MHTYRRVVKSCAPVWFIGILAAVAAMSGCAVETRNGEHRTAQAFGTPVPLNPESPEASPTGPVGRVGTGTDLTQPDAFVRGRTAAEIIDTRTFPMQIQTDVANADLGGGAAEPRLVREMLHPHTKPEPPPVGPANNLRAGQTLDQTRTIPQRSFPTVGSTGWNPPDPTLAVGPSHVVVTVNSRVAFYTKAGVQTFAAPLDSTGNPGFFEPLGAGGFCFDPKCIYDHLSGRFVIVVLETYTDQAWVDVAISDDSDPNGVWFKYRTEAVIVNGTNRLWWDFPGIGYDAQAYYVTGNLFSLNGGAYGGFGLRIFDKSTMLSGGTAAYSTLRNTGYTVQPALHFGATTTPYLATIENSTSVRVWAVNNPLTAPALVSTLVTVPSYSGAISAPTLNSTPVSSAGFTMPYWRNGRMVLCLNASIGGRNVARWHELATNTWPASGAVTRIQSGDVDAGANIHTIFPAIAVNSAGDVGMSLGLTSEGMRVGAAIAGRLAADPVGRMGTPMLVKPGDVDAGGRWGDYYAVAIDPTDDTTFWAVGEYRNNSGWQNWVGSFSVAAMSLCHPVPDDFGVVQIGVDGARTVDVLANDWHSTGATMTIQSFDAASTLGGVITRSIGTGPGGRDQLTYTPPVSLAGASGYDSFNYRVTDGLTTSSAAAVGAVFYPTNYRNPENPAQFRAGVRADWYALTAPDTLPNFGTLDPYGWSVLANINIPSTTGNISSSGRADNLGAVMEGYINIATSGVYRLLVTSDDGSKLYLGSTLIADNNGAHGMVEKASTLVGLKPGRHRVKVEYFEGGGGAGLIVGSSSTTQAQMVVPASAWFTFCAADFNRTGTVTVQDIFDFLSAYFSGNVRADFNASGAVSVQDIFDFLGAYFAGC